ncbi:hypothetical protein BV25DRAFT_1843335 [Artomyces pyxidatus]|uniref:Uncharacterized protein n=1 Tax=Artomyces pyxidatus TaxID=48021 RepID=A0ACB8SGH8_9AGAM|nr:hypothetical protein BV25DRAFT_1843335 [Artomyces pyxidatus]
MTLLWWGHKERRLDGAVFSAPSLRGGRRGNQSAGGASGLEFDGFVGWHVVGFSLDLGGRVLWESCVEVAGTIDFAIGFNCRPERMIETQADIFWRFPACICRRSTRPASTLRQYVVVFGSSTRHCRFGDISSIHISVALCVTYEISYPCTHLGVNLESGSDKGLAKGEDVSSGLLLTAPCNICVRIGEMRDADHTNATRGAAVTRLERSSERAKGLAGADKERTLVARSKSSDVLCESTSLERSVIVYTMPAQVVAGKGLKGKNMPPSVGESRSRKPTVPGNIWRTTGNHLGMYSLRLHARCYTVRLDRGGMVPNVGRLGHTPLGKQHPRLSLSANGGRRVVHPAACMRRSSEPQRGWIVACPHVGRDRLDAFDILPGKYMGGKSFEGAVADIQQSAQADTLVIHLGVGTALTSGTICVHLLLAVGTKGKGILLCSQFSPTLSRISRQGAVEHPLDRHSISGWTDASYTLNSRPILDSVGTGPARMGDRNDFRGLLPGSTLWMIPGGAISSTRVPLGSPGSSDDLGHGSLRALPGKGVLSRTAILQALRVSEQFFNSTELLKGPQIQSQRTREGRQIEGARSLCDYAISEDLETYHTIFPLQLGVSEKRTLGQSGEVVHFLNIQSVPTTSGTGTEGIPYHVHSLDAPIAEKMICDDTIGDVIEDTSVALCVTYEISYPCTHLGVNLESGSDKGLAKGEDVSSGLLLTAPCNICVRIGEMRDADHTNATRGAAVTRLERSSERAKGLAGADKERTLVARSKSSDVLCESTSLERSVIVYTMPAQVVAGKGLKGKNMPPSVGESRSRKPTVPGNIWRTTGNHLGMYSLRLHARCYTVRLDRGGMVPNVGRLGHTPLGKQHPRLSLSANGGRRVVHPAACMRRSSEPQRGWIVACPHVGRDRLDAFDILPGKYMGGAPLISVHFCDVIKSLEGKDADKILR